MPTRTIRTNPTPVTVAFSGRFFQVVSGVPVKVRFTFENEETVEDEIRVGDLIEFTERYKSIEISSDWASDTEVYYGLAKLTRMRQDFSLTGAASIRSGNGMLGKVEQMILPADANRRSVAIFCEESTIYVGSIGTTQNEKMPVAAGSGIEIGTTQAIYAQLDATHTSETVIFRFLEEIN